MQEHLATKQLFCMHFFIVFLFCFLCFLYALLIFGLYIILILVTLLKSETMLNTRKNKWDNIKKTENQPKTLLVYTEINHTKINLNYLKSHRVIIQKR